MSLLFAPRQWLSIAAFCTAGLGAGLSPALAQDHSRENRIATAVEIALPMLAGYCAVKQGRGKEFAASFAVETITVQGLKYGLGDAGINRRPNGGDRGFPSGHAALAMYGATNLTRKCLPQKPVLGALAYGTALAVGASRIHTRHHNAGQVFSGLAIGYFANGVSVGVGPGGMTMGFDMNF